MRRDVAIRVAKIAGSTADPAFATDHAGKIVAWNSAMEGLLGHAAKEVLGRNCWDVFHGTDVFDNLYCRQNCPLLDADHPPRNCCLHTHSEVAAPVLVQVHTLTIPETAPANVAVLHVLQRQEGPETASRAIAAHAAAQPGANLPGDRQQLTARQRQVLRLLAQGLRTHEISAALGISDKTARNHIQNITERLGVLTRSAAVACAIQSGLI